MKPYTKHPALKSQSAKRKGLLLSRELRSYVFSGSKFKFKKYREIQYMYCCSLCIFVSVGLRLKQKGAHK